jgi:Anti-sigma factor NepR
VLANLRPCRESDKQDSVGGHRTRPDAGVDSEAVRIGVAAALLAIHSDLLREEVPDRIAELLRQLDEQ